MSHGFVATNAPTPPSTEEAQRRKLVDRELRRLAKARRNRIKHHPCPTCETSGSIRRSFGFAYAGDPKSEAFQILVCPTCDGDGAQPAGRAPVALRPGERAATWWEVNPTVRMSEEEVEDEVDEILTSPRSMGVIATGDPRD